MKILRIAADIYPEVVGGYGIHIHEMSKMQAEMGHDVTVFTKRINGQPIQEERSGYIIKRFKPNLKIFGNAITLTMVRDLYHNFDNYDIIHTHSHLFFPTNLSVFFKKIKNAPLVITNHGLISQTAPLWFSNVYNMTLGKWTLNGADVIISYSEEEKKIMEILGVKTTISIIHNGINTDLFKPIENVEKKNQILWVGRFIPGKGVQYIIEAFAILKKSDEDLKLKLVGDGPLKNEIKEMTRELKIHDSVIFEEFVENEDMPLVYNKSKVFILPSLAEGVPRTILEAMSCGIPVVSTDLPQIKNLVSNCGIIVPKKNFITLAEAIDKLLSNEDLRKIYGINGREKIIKHYTWEDTVEKTVNVYKECLDLHNLIR